MGLRGLPGKDEIKFRKHRWSMIRQVSDALHANLMRNFLQANGYDVAVRNGRVSNPRSKTLADHGSPISILVPMESARAAARLLRLDGESYEDGSADSPKAHIDIDQDEELIADEELDDLLDSENLVGTLGDDEDSY
jgi:hypothetical protein